MAVDSLPIRSRPHPRLRALLRAATLGTARELIWNDLRAGVIVLRGLAPAQRAQVRVGFALVTALLALLLLGAQLRQSSSLIAPAVNVQGGITTAPTALIPLVLCAVSVAWTYLLAGALAAGRGMCAAITVTYLVVTVPLWQRFEASLAELTPQMWTGWAGMLGVIVVALTRTRTAHRPGAQFGLLLGCVGTTYLAAQAHLTATEAGTGLPRLLPMLENSVLVMGLLITPMLGMAGLAVANFMHRLARWTVVVARTGPAGILVPALLTATLGWLTWQSVRLLAGIETPGEALPYIGALVLPLAAWGLLIGIDSLRRQRTTPPVVDDVDDPPADQHGPAPGTGSPADALVNRSSRTALPLATGFFGWRVLIAVLSSAVLAGGAVVGATASAGLTQAATSFVDLLTDRGLVWWWLGFDLLLLGLAAGLVLRRGERLLPLFLALVAVTDLWLRALTDVPALSPFEWQGVQPLVFWGTCAEVALIAVLWLRGQLTAERLAQLLAAAVILLLLGAPIAVSQPFSPFLLSSGVGVMAFGLAWDAVTSGNWANRDTRRLPHASRVLLYPGYLMLSLTIICWAVITHDFAGLEFLTGQAADIGFAQFGVPLLIAAVLLLMRECVPPRGTPASSGEELLTRKRAQPPG